MWQWLGLIGPGLSAIIVSFAKDQTKGLKDLFTPLTFWRVPIIYYIFIYFGVFFFYCAASWLTVLVQSKAQIHNWEWYYNHIRAPFFGLRGIWVLIQMTIIYTFCEELGWRGFALPALVEKYNTLNATLLIGIIWTLWHVPLIYLNGAHFTLTTFIMYLVHIICMSVFYSWLYFRSKKSLLLVGLFHGATDGIGAFFPITASVIGQGPNLPTLIMEIIIALLLTPYLYRFSDKKDSHPDNQSF